jgi:hypothetical protein
MRPALENEGDKIRAASDRPMASTPAGQLRLASPAVNRRLDQRKPTPGCGDALVGWGT